MPRLARNDIETAYHHIMVQGIAREHIFEDNQGKERYLRRISDLLKENKIEVLAYCIMSNHAHFLVYIDNIQALSDSMRKANTAYAVYYNKKKKRVGYVFRDRYRSEPVKDERHLLSCIVYIHNNPIAAGMCEERCQYKWSSWHEYMNESKIVAGAEKILKGLSAVDIKRAREEFDNLHIKEYEEKWLENYDYALEDVEELLNKYIFLKGKDIEEIKKDKEMMIDLVKHLQYNTGISLRAAAQLLAINRETLRKIMSIPPSP